MESNDNPEASEAVALSTLQRDILTELEWEMKKRRAQGRFPEIRTDIVQRIQNLPAGEQERLPSLPGDLLETVNTEIYEKDLELIEEDCKDEEDRLTELQTRPSFKFRCNHCTSDIAPEEPFLHCIECDMDVARSNGKLLSDFSFDLCLKCYIHGVEHKHDLFITSGVFCGRLRFIDSNLVSDRSDYQLQAEGFPDNALNLKAYRDSAQMNRQPLSQMLQRYLDIVDISNHHFNGKIRELRSIVGSVTKKTSFHALKNWAIACYLLADHDFFKRTKTPALRTLLSPVQRASFGLLKEWWLSEIQDPKLMQHTISDLVIDCLAPPMTMFAHWAEERKNRYNRDYHGALLQLFHAEFDTLWNGTTSGSASASLFSKRTEASVQACRQRMAYCVVHPSMSPPWFHRKHGQLFEDDIRLSCRKWRRGVRFACAELLAMIRATDGPKDFCWLMIDIVTEGPIELYVANRKFAEQVFGSRPFSASLTPLPWLSHHEIQGSRPHYLWDARQQKTVETSCMATLPAYIAISHTWGRWKSHCKESLAIPGVPWLVPQNKLWDVAGIPEKLRNVPGAYRYIWFDLVCIPQSPEAGSHLKNIEISEIAKQAAIFGNAKNAAAWLNTISRRELEHLRISILLLSSTSGNFVVDHSMEWEEWEKMRPGFSQRYWVEKDEDNIRDATPLVREDRRSLLGTGTDPAEYVNQWFTSLWTLQEVCMRPDMWLCAEDWTTLRLFNTPSWQIHQNIGIDALVALIEDFRNNSLLERSPFPNADSNLFHIETENNLETAKARSEMIRSSFMDLNGYDPSHVAVEKAIATGETRMLPIAMPWDIHIIKAMFVATGINHLLYTSPMDILVLADRRECKRRRAEAIMSAVGAVSWYQDHHAEQNLVLDRYPLHFLEEIRTKVGNADFFQSRLLTRKAIHILDEFTLKGSLPPAAGTLLPFGSQSAFETAYTRDRLLSDPVEKRSHPSLLSWQIRPDGSVHMEEASILQWTYAPEHICDCLLMKLDEVDYYRSESSGTVRRLKSYEGHPKDWRPGRDPHTRHCCFLVCLDLVETHDHFSLARIQRFQSHGVVLQELQPGTLIKIGSFVVSGCEEHVCPESTEESSLTPLLSTPTPASKAARNFSALDYISISSDSVGHVTDSGASTPAARRSLESVAKLGGEEAGPAISPVITEEEVGDSEYSEWEGIVETKRSKKRKSGKGKKK